MLRVGQSSGFRRALGHSVRFAAAPPTPRARPRPAAARGDSSANGGGRTANPYGSFEGRVKHWHMIAMCVGCGAVGIAVGQFVDVDEKELKRALVTPYDRDAIEAHFAKAFEYRPDLAATTLRAAFVDASARAVRAGAIDAPAAANAATGPLTGFDACRSARGLQDVNNQVAFLKGLNPQASNADILTLGAIAAVRFLKGPADKIVFRWGRKDLDDAGGAAKAEEPKGVMRFFEKKEASQDKHQSSGGNDGIQFYRYLERIIPNLNLEEAVALMAAHAVGEFHPEVTGIDAALYNRVSKHKFWLGHHYYQLLIDIADQFIPARLPPQGKADRERPTAPDMLEASAEMRHPTTGKPMRRLALVTRMEAESLVRDLEGIEVATSFAMDGQMWQREFASGMTKLLDANHAQLRQYISPNTKPEKPVRTRALEPIAIDKRSKPSA